MKVNISLDDEQFTHKPEKSYIGKINNRIASQNYMECISELAKMIGEDGRSFCPAL